jgi:hypothetical protein
VLSARLFSASHALNQSPVLSVHAIRVLVDTIVDYLPRWAVLDHGDGVQLCARSRSHRNRKFWVIAYALRLPQLAKSGGRPSYSFLGFRFHSWEYTTSHVTSETSPCFF